MSVSLASVIEHGGYDLSTLEDAQWLVATQQEYAELIEAAEELIEERESEESDESY